MSSAAHAKSNRILGFDVTRFLAILAMVFVNYEVTLAYGATEPEALAQIANLLEGRAAALFVVLAGVGLTLLNNRRVIVKRAFFLMVVGYAWQTIWPGDILHYYGFYLLFGALVLNCRARALFALAPLTVAVSLLLHIAFANTSLAYEMGWNWDDLSYVDFWQPLGQFRNLVFNGWHPLFPWLAFLFLGMALGKVNIAEKHPRRIAFVCGVAATSLAGWLATEWLWGLDSIPPGPWYVLSAAGSAVATLALVLEITANRGKPTALISAMATAGQYALTFYIAHVLFGLYDLEFLLDESNFQPGGAPTSSELLLLAGKRTLLFGAGAFLFSWLWNKRFHKGPLEWVMRRLAGS